MIIATKEPYEHLDLARKHVDKKTKHTHVLSEEAFDRVPKFQLSELDLGRVLGHGGFGVVSEITKINLDDNFSSSDGSDTSESRTHMKEASSAGGKFVIKCLLEKSHKDPIIYFRAVVDLALEARFLSVLRHPHILALRGTAATDPYDDNFFLVLDRLYEILSLRLKTWKKKQPSRLMDRTGKKKRSLYIARCQVAYDICCALAYMHSLNILYRDTKPDNVGFTQDDEVKIFDFDLIREVDPNSSLQDGTYKLTSQTGSTRYMAPEIALGMPYNESVDVYSFSILVWQILHLETPFDAFTPHMFEEYVIKTGVRPKCDTTHVMTTPLASLLRRGWNANWKQRPTMVEMGKGLLDEIGRMGGKVAISTTSVMNSASGSLTSSQDFSIENDANDH